ncbi:hypothetical protein DUNSADRAFT_12344 [Dunaliella salina]|uniref:Uncharacterized protein n=1 Tax=Dunaliella salina TaxID=3046 RepID=A0ABQ7GBG3_DUNSA|nr:hypothetical protein DUNSADRAFT_12344 [Dunaliella salina]|eukprot:KAF5831949.1 hypothetical protein DUNSADRAFT_12344 [Dunaliella salina]
MCRYWYTRGKSGPAVSVEEERRAVKQKEEELMLEALGLKPKSLPTDHKPMDQKELDAIIKNNAPEKEEGAEQAAIKGLGFAPGAGVGGGVAVHAKLEGVGVGPGEGAAARAVPAGPSGHIANTTSRHLAKRETKRAKKARRREAKGQKRGREGAEEDNWPNSKREGHSRRSCSRDSGSSSSSGGSEGSSSSSGGEDGGRGRASLSPPPPTKASRAERARDGVVGDGRRRQDGGDERRRDMGYDLDRGGGYSSRGGQYGWEERSTGGGGGGYCKRQRHDSPAGDEEVSGREDTRPHRHMRRERSRSRERGREDSRAPHRSSRGESRDRRRR